MTEHKITPFAIGCSGFEKTDTGALSHFENRRRLLHYKCIEMLFSQ